MYISIASSYSSMKSHVDRAITLLLNELSELPEIDRLRLIFKLNHEDMVCLGFLLCFILQLLTYIRYFKTLSHVGSLLGRFIQDALELISRTNTKNSNLFGVHVAIINETVWPYSGYTTYFDDQWTLILNCEDELKLAQRMFAAVTDVLLDTSHLSAIVRRDLRQRIQPSEIIALSASQQVSFVS